MSAPTTRTANEVARIVSRAVGRTVTAKQVRAYGRAHIGRLDDDKYTPTAYSTAEVARIVAHFKGTTARSKAQTEAPRKRRTTPSKGTRAARKASAVAESAEASDAVS